MKRIVGLFIALVLMLGLVAGPVAQAADLPALGDSLNGFAVTALGTERLLDAPTVTFEHDKTGAQVLYIAADDIDRSFQIAFQTPAMDNTGLPHVFEHITISGSEKYPAQNLFFPMASQTYNTFVNAYTYPIFTGYPLSSLSEEQLMRLADYYLDGVFHPLVYTEERLYKREAWRYQLADAEAPLTITGTVYNEMRGATTIYSSAERALLAALYPDSIRSNEYGGDPDFIPDMTWQNLLDFHDAYYHPSNSLTVLYGAMDYAQFLALLDSYFSGYDRQEIYVEKGEVEPQSGLVEAIHYYPVEAGYPEDNTSLVYYGYVANDADLDTTLSLLMANEMLLHEASPLTDAVRAEFPNASLFYATDFSITDPYFALAVEGVDAEDAEAFQQIVDESIASIAEEGISAEIVDAVLAAEEFSNLLATESPNVGVNLSSQIALFWSGRGTLEFYNTYLDTLDALRAKAGEGYLEGLLREYFIDNAHKALVTTVPAAGMAEEKAAELEARLAEVKASLSAEEIEALVEDTKAQEAWGQEEAPKALVESLQAVTVSELPEEMKAYDVVENEEDGVRYITANASVGNISSTQLLMDTSAIDQDMLLYYKLYTSLLGMVSTEQYDRTELQTLTTRYLNSFGISASTLRFEEGGYQPVFTASWMNLMDEYETALNLAHEVLFHSKLDELDIIQAVISQQKLGMRSQYNNMTYILQMSRTGAIYNEETAYSNYIDGLDYYNFLSEAEAMLQDDPQALLDKLEEVRALLNNKQNAIVLYASNEDGMQVFDDHKSLLLSDIPAEPIEAAAYAFDKPAMSEALVVDSSIQYNMLHISLEELGIDYSAKLQTLRTLLYDGFLTPQIRHSIGAYDTITISNKYGLTFSSYRDPSIADTFAVFGRMADYAATAEITQEDIDRYTLSVYSSYATPTGELSGALAAMSYHITGTPSDEKITRMRELKSVTVEDLRNLAPILEKLYTEGARSTGGGAMMIDQNADLYDTIIRIDSAE